jgi:uncharacterized membrane protein (UPF0127 family)
LKKKTTIIAIAIVAAILLLSLAIVVFYNFHSATLTSCSPNGSLLTRTSREKNNDLLGGFPVSCIRVLDQKRAVVIAGFVYVASSQEQLEQGFMNVTTFGNCNGFANESSPCVGMIFAFSSTQQECFWMHDTILPLLQSWIATNGTVTAIYSASPETDATVCHPGQYVLESNASALISVDDRVQFNET